MTCCQKCPHNVEIERLSAICANCRFNDSPAGGGAISLDAIIEGAESVFLKVDPSFDMTTSFDPREIDEPRQVHGVTPLSLETEDALRKLLSELAQLPPHVVLLLHGLLSGKTVAEIGQMTGDTKQTAHARLKSAIRRFPWLGYFYRIVRSSGWRFNEYKPTTVDRRLRLLCQAEGMVGDAADTASISRRRKG